MKIELIDYTDVWGNQEDGYDVNEQTSYGKFEFDREETPEGVVDFLIEEGFLKPTVKADDIRLDNSGDMYIDILDAKSDKPLFAFNILD